jgi:hypothetical protein
MIRNINMGLHHAEYDNGIFNKPNLIRLDGMPVQQESFLVSFDRY